MSEETIQRILQARKAIKAGEYDKARKLLKGVDHPKAREWLAKLDNIPTKSKRKERKIGIIQYVILGTICVCALLTLLIFLVPSTPEITTAELTATAGVIFISDNRLFPTSTALPLTDPFAQYIFATVSGIERIENVNSLSIPGRDETQYDFAVRLLDNANMNATLEAVSAAVGAYRAENNISSIITFNVLVVQGARTENWRYSGSEWFRRAINGAAVTATPYPTRDPNAVVAPVYVPAQNQSNASVSASYQCNCDKLCTTMSCEEAQFQLNRCNCQELDNNNDGIACNAQC